MQNVLLFDAGRCSQSLSIHRAILIFDARLEYRLNYRLAQQAKRTWITRHFLNFFSLGLTRTKKYQPSVSMLRRKRYLLLAEISSDKHNSVQLARSQFGTSLT